MGVPAIVSVLPFPSNSGDIAKWIRAAAIQYNHEGHDMKRTNPLITDWTIRKSLAQALNFCRHEGGLSIGSPTSYGRPEAKARRTWAKRAARATALTIQYNEREGDLHLGEKPENADEGFDWE